MLCLGVCASFGVFGVPLNWIYVLDRLCLKVFLYVRSHDIASRGQAWIFGGYF